MSKSERGHDYGDRREGSHPDGSVVLPRSTFDTTGVMWHKPNVQQILRQIEASGDTPTLLRHYLQSGKLADDTERSFRWPAVGRRCACQAARVTVARPGSVGDERRRGRPRSRRLRPPSRAGAAGRGRRAGAGGSRVARRDGGGLGGRPGRRGDGRRARVVGSGATADEADVAQRQGRVNAGPTMLGAAERSAAPARPLPSLLPVLLRSANRTHGLIIALGPFGEDDT